ncbi:MAG: nucleoside 2-deoxyribosyltransferase [Patescibacteria group bacterium]
MKSVVICASKKYKDEVRHFCSELNKLGVVIYEPNINEPVPEDSFFHSKLITKTIFKGFTLEHFDWIRKADVCFIYNKDNYVGASVTLEMGYAVALGKPLYALSKTTGDPCRDCLIDKVVSSSAKLVKLLK